MYLNTISLKFFFIVYESKMYSLLRLQIGEILTFLSKDFLIRYFTLDLDTYFFLLLKVISLIIYNLMQKNKKKTSKQHIYNF